MDVRRLGYAVHKCSSHLPGLPPQNVTVDRPSDQTSRWSTETNAPPQYLVVKLERPAIVKTITFGKYNKTHVCNLKKFTVLGGMRDENMSELLNGGLANNAIKETFNVRHATAEGRPFPVRFISVVPHQSWGPSFNFSIWYLEFHGIDDPAIVRRALFNFSMHAEKETIRICLKHFRQQRYTTAFEHLQKQTGVSLESPRLSRLYESLVERGDFDSAEKLLQTSAKEGLFDWYASRQPYAASWSNVSPCSPELVARLSDGSEETPPQSSPTPPSTTSSPVRETEGCAESWLPGSEIELPDMDKTRPGRRGGHQMCIDPATNSLYLFGGWDGDDDLSDLWSYNVSEEKWTLIFRYSDEVGGPKPRSCHKMVLDPIRRQLFVLGRYLEAKNRTMENTKSDMYVFDITECRWYQICDDTAARGGPSLVFDHQMCIDIEKHIIYVFGGRILQTISEEEQFPQYSGLYAYHIAEDRWQLLLADVLFENPTVPTILSRFGHSMLFHPFTHTLYIFGGQRNKEHQADLLAVQVGDIDTGNSDPKVNVRAVCTAAPPRRAPPTGFTQRATIDPELNEIYVLSGLSKEKDKRISNSLWVYSITNSQWSCIYKNDHQGYTYWTKLPATEPCPRFAHQLVYDPINKIHYLFGGNPGRVGQPSLRLDDFWILRLSRINSTSALWRARLELRRLRFQELADSGKIHEALAYLQTYLYQATDHSDPEQERQFQLLATMLFSENLETVSFNPPLDANDSLSKSYSCALSDPELHEDIQDEKYDPSNYPEVARSFASDAEQQALFAAVLGMESSNSESNEVKNYNYNTSNDNFLTRLLHDSDQTALNYIDKDIEETKWNNWETHYRRCQLFQQLSEYFPQHMVQPKKNLTDFIVF